MGKDGSFSELEYLVLSLVDDGTPSGYGIKKRINRTQHGRWNGDSGAVYRVLRRLEKAGLIEESGRIGPVRRERTEYRMTPEGKTVINAWWNAPPDEKELGYLVDPMRTRSYFLGRLEPAVRVRVVDRWLLESQKFCEGLEKDVETNQFGDRIRDAAYTNLLYLAKARHDWLKDLRSVVTDEG